MSVSTNFLASQFEIYWDDELGAARFEENKKFTASDGLVHDYSQSGTLHISAEIKMVHMLTARHGALRLITLTGIQRIPEVVMYGAILTQVPEAGHYIPAKSTIHFRKINDANGALYSELIGPITPDHYLYEKISDDLDEADRVIYTR